MPKLIKKQSKKVGLPPGTLVHIGQRKTESARISVIDYNEQNFQEKRISAIEECLQFKETSTVTWINIDGIHEINLIDELGRQFELHPLILEDLKYRATSQI